MIRLMSIADAPSAPMVALVDCGSIHRLTLGTCASGSVVQYHARSVRTQHPVWPVRPQTISKATRCHHQERQRHQDAATARSTAVGLLIVHSDHLPSGTVRAMKGLSLHAQKICGTEKQVEIAYQGVAQQQKL